ncbi:MAG: phasin family protein [Proteobacteria bacterium]|nr:phasin family protein [Pseudomonadota bacterium]
MQEVMKMFDMSKMAEQMKDMCKFENIKEMSEKNMEQCKKANEVLVEGMNTYTKRQAEITKETVEANIAAVKDVASSKTVEEFVANQKEATDAWVKRNTAAVTELSDMMKESQEKATEIVKGMMKAN